MASKGEDRGTGKVTDASKGADRGEGANINNNARNDESSDTDEEADIDEEADVDEETDIEESYSDSSFHDFHPDNAPIVFKEAHEKWNNHELVLSRQNSLSQKSPQGQACETGNADYIRLMVQFRVNNPIHPSMLTVLYAAIGHNQHEIITLLHSLGADLNFEHKEYTPLMWACHFNTCTVHQLLILGANAQQTNYFKETALHIALEVKNITAVHLLLRVAPALINVKAKYGDVPLVRPCSYGESNPELVKLLLEYGADVNFAEIADRQTPLHLAAAAGNREVMELLLQANAIVNALDIHALTPLHLAMVNEEQEMVKMLFDAGAQIEVAREDNGETALFFACRFGHMMMLKALMPYLQLHHIYRTNKPGQSSLDLADELRREEIASILRCIIQERTSPRGLFSLFLDNV